MVPWLWLLLLWLLVLLIDHFLIPQLLLTHLLAHFFLQIGYFLLQPLLNLLLNDSPNQGSQMYWYGLKILDLILRLCRLGGLFLYWHLKLLWWWHQNLRVLRLDGHFLFLLRDDRTLFLFLRCQNPWLGLLGRRLLPQYKQDDPVGKLARHQ